MRKTAAEHRVSTLLCKIGFPHTITPKLSDRLAAKKELLFSILKSFLPDMYRTNMSTQIMLAPKVQARKEVSNYVRSAEKATLY